MGNAEREDFWKKNFTAKVAGDRKRGVHAVRGTRLHWGFFPAIVGESCVGVRRKWKDRNLHFFWRLTVKEGVSNALARLGRSGTEVGSGICCSFAAPVLEVGVG